MHFKILRIRLRLKREFVKVLKYQPHKFTSIVRGEKKPFSSVGKIEMYSKGLSLEVIDPRSGSARGHYFNRRDIYKVQNVILEPRQGLIYSSDGKLISESTNWSTSNLYESFPWNPRNVRRKLNVGLAINLTSSAFGHWLVEDLASTIYLIEKYPSVPVLISKTRSRFVDELIKFLNCEVIEIDGPVQVNNLLMTTKENDSGWMNPKDLEVLEGFRNKIPEITAPHNSKIYATRRSLKRSPCNEPDIELVFQDYGYEVLKLEDLDFISEISLMKNVTHLAGVSGSWQFNSIWMKSHTTMIDIANENYWTELAHRVCDLKEIDYRYLVYQGTYNSEVNLGSLRRLLDSIHL
jgi:hypothetical protein